MSLKTTIDGRTITVSVEGDMLVLSDKKKRHIPPTVVRTPILSIIDGSNEATIDTLLRKLPVEDLSDIKPAYLGYELKARLLAICKPRPEIPDA